MLLSFKRCLLSRIFYYLSKTKDKFPLKLFADLDMSKKVSKLALGYRKTKFLKKKLKMYGNKNI